MFSIHFPHLCYLETSPFHGLVHQFAQVDALNIDQYKRGLITRYTALDWLAEDADGLNYIAQGSSKSNYPSMRPSGHVVAE